MLQAAVLVTMGTEIAEKVTNLTTSVLFGGIGALSCSFFLLDLFYGLF